MNENIDPRIDKMIAFLYGELPDAEARAFERLLEKDDDLRREYEELAGTRSQLAGWEVEERTPSFVMVDRPSVAASRAPRETAWSRFVDSLRGFGMSPAWGLAAAALLLVVLAATGFRVQKIDGGIAFRFGEPEPAVTVPVQGSREFAPNLTPGQLASSPLPGQNAGYVTPVSDGYITPELFQRKSEEQMMTIVSLLNEFGRQQERERYNMVQSMYQQVTDEQSRDFRQLSGRIEAIGLGVMTNQVNQANQAGIPIEDLPVGTQDRLPTNESGKE